jgi:hypothetical protein
VLFSSVAGGVPRHFQLRHPAIAEIYGRPY